MNGEPYDMTRDEVERAYEARLTDEEWARVQSHPRFVSAVSKQDYYLRLTNIAEELDLDIAY